MDGQEGEKLSYQPIPYACQTFDDFYLGTDSGLTRMDVETRVVFPRHQQAGLFRVKDFLLFTAVRHSERKRRTTAVAKHLFS